MHADDDEHHETTEPSGEEILPIRAQHTLPGISSDPTHLSDRRQGFASLGDRVHLPAYRESSVSSAAISWTFPTNSSNVPDEDKKPPSSPPGFASSVIYSPSRRIPPAHESGHIGRNAFETATESVRRVSTGHYFEQGDVTSHSPPSPHIIHTRLSAGENQRPGGGENVGADAYRGRAPQHASNVPEVGSASNETGRKNGSSFQSFRDYAMLPRLNVSIPNGEAVVDVRTGERYISYRIEVTINAPEASNSQTAGHSVGFRPLHVVYRSYKAVESLQRKLSTLYSYTPTLPARESEVDTFDERAVEEQRLQLELFVRSIIEVSVIFQHALTPTYFSSIVAFLDDDSCSLGTKIKCEMLEAKLMDLTVLCRNLHLQAERTIASSAAQINILQKRIDELEARRGMHRVHSDNSLTGGSQQRYQSAATSSRSESFNNPSLFISTESIASLTASDPSFLLLGTNVTTSALIRLATTILSERGPMPVGEVGKLLQEATSNPQLSHILKEKFNGLKKFLEKFPDVFLISNDHPFNPHVYLRSAFNVEEQQQIEAGSTAFLLTLKKAKKTRRKGKSTSSQRHPAPVAPGSSFASAYSLEGARIKQHKKGS